MKNISTCEKNVLIYIDYENIHKTLLNENKNLLGTGFFEKLRKWCTNNNYRVIDIIAYCNFDLKDLYESHHQTKLQEYGIETIHTSNKGKNFADLKITADLLEQMHTNNKIDGFILISNDKDMTPLIKAIKKYKDFIYLITAGSNFDESLLNFPDKTLHLDDIIKLEIKSKLEIEKIYDEIYDSLNNYLKNKFNDFLEYKKQQKQKEDDENNKDNNDNNTNSNNYTKPFVLDYGLEYYINSSFSHFNIMKYEFANIIKELASNGSFYLYNYTYYNRRYKKQEKDIAITTKDLVKQYIDNEVMSQKDIIRNYDFNSIIHKIYKEYCFKK